MKIIFLAYRSWALDVVSHIKMHANIDEYEVFNSQKAFYEFIKGVESTDYLVLAIGWSDILKREVVEEFMCVGMHPSDLPHYRGGSPIQHQIIDGVGHTKASLFRLTSELDEGGVYLKEDLSLMGNNVDQIFDNIKNSSIRLFNRYLDLYPNISIDPQVRTDIPAYLRRKPSDSKIELEEFVEPNLVSLFNKIRCLTDPYPNAYIEDKYGNKLFFTGARIEESNEE